MEKIRNSHSKSAIWLFLEKVLRVASGLFVTAAVARHLGPGSYGSLAIALGTVAVFTAGASMGAEQINNAELSTRNWENARKFLISAILSRLFWASAFLIIFLIFLFINSQSDDTMYFIVAACIPISAFSILGNKLQSDGDFVRYAQLSCVAIIMSGAIKVVGIVQQSQVQYFAAAAVFDVAVQAAVFLAWIIRQNGFIFFQCKPHLATALAYIKLCMPTAASAIMVAIYLRLELFMVNELIDAKAAGLWAAALMFIAPWNMVASSILPIANTSLAKSGINEDNYDDKIIKLIRLMLIISVIPIFFNSLFAIYISSFVLGDKYNDIRYIVIIASLSVIPIFMGSVQEIWIAHQKTTKIVLKKIILGLPISVILLYYLIGEFGIYGVAIGMVTSYFFTAIFLNYLFDRRFLKLQLSAIGFTFAR